VLFRRWIAGEPSTARANEILGSIGLDTDGQKASAHKLAYMAVYHSIILLERSHGVPVNTISRQWKIKNLEGIEERWRDDLLWLLAGTSKILDLRCFYFHLREDCHADDKRVKRVKKHLQRVQWLTYELQEQLKYCSPLGSLLVDIRRTSHTSRKVGLQTIRRIEAAGITSLQQLSQLTVEQLSSLGVQHHLAAQIIQYIHRRRD
jgi:helicase